MIEREQPTKPNPASNGASVVLKLFVYGTLKRGYRNYAPFCQQALENREAQVRGCLYKKPRAPALMVPEWSILAVGTQNPLSDALTQASLSAHQEKTELAPSASTVRTWDAVHGELLTFNNPESHLPPIDQLEDFLPGNNSSRYHRVLVRAAVNNTSELAWVYTVKTIDPTWPRIASGCWPG